MLLVVPLVWFAMAQGPAVPLIGTVVGPDGKPVAGAELILTGMPYSDAPIVARGTSDALGRFRLERPAGLAGETKIIAPTLWTVKPGLRLSMTKFPGPMPGADEPVRVVLGPPGKAEVRVVGPDGRPAAGVRVRVEWLGKDSTNVPDPVVDRIEAKTDADGLAIIDAVSNDEVGYIDVHGGQAGIQGRQFYPTSPRPKRVSLRPAAALEGRLVADDPKLIRGWRVRAYTRSGDQSLPDPDTNGYATGTTDDGGRFSFPSIAGGSLQLVLTPPGELPVIADLTRVLSVTEGRANVVEIPLRPAATIAGVVRERGTGLPVADVGMWLVPDGPGGSETTKTDAEGRYTFRALAGKAKMIVNTAPRTHDRSSATNDRKEFTIPGGTGRVDLAPIEIARAAPPIRGVVRDEAGNAVAGASVTGLSPAGNFAETADGRGEFTLWGLAPGRTATIEARHGDRTTASPVEAVAGAAGPVNLKIVPGLTLALEGRVVGPGGRPVAGALIKFQCRKQPKDGQFSFPESVGFGDGVEIRTGPDGTFRTPKALDRKAKDFHAEATADGFLPNSSGWVATSGGDVVTIPDIPLRRSRTLRVVAGRVVDREGRGVAGASAFQSGDGPKRTATTTDDAGRFRLDGVASGEALVFVEKAGFRFGGAVVGPGGEGVEVRIARVDGPPLSSMKPPPSPISRADERAMARELLAPLLPAATLGSLGFAGNSVVPSLARVDPGRVLAMLENRVLADSAQVLVQVALGQFEDDPRVAVATIEADTDPAARAGGFLALADVAGPRLKAELLDRALAEARRVVDKESRVHLLGQVADRWLDGNAVDRATPILREGQALIATLPKDRYFPWAEGFADVLAAIDLPAARPIFAREGQTNVSKPDEGTLQRHRGEAAVRLAAIDPALAESLVPAVVPNFWDDSRAEYVLRICRRMARVDRARARKILDSIRAQDGPGASSRPTLIPCGLGLMAAELAEVDPAGARGLLDEAFAGLRSLAAGGSGDRFNPTSSVAMAELLPLVERLEPDRLGERAWLAASCRSPSVEVMDAHAVQGRIVLAMLISRYDRAIAAAIIAPALERLPELLADPAGNSFYSMTPIMALVVYDPRLVVAMLRALPDSSRKAPEEKDAWNAVNVDTQVRLAAAQMLGLPIEERRRKSIAGSFYPWPLRQAR